MTVEDEFHMKKYSPLIALTLLAGCVTFAPLRARTRRMMTRWARLNASGTTPATRRDNEKCYQQSRKCWINSPQSKYRPNAERNVKSYDRNKASENFKPRWTPTTSGRHRTRPN